MEKMSLVLFFLIMYDGYEDTVKKIRSETGLSRDSAIVIMRLIDDIVRDLSDGFADIATVNTSRFNKRAMINNLIRNYFIDESSTVQVSSKKRKTIKEYKIRNYLTTLSRLKELYGYSQVEISFDPDYLHMGEFLKVMFPSGEYEEYEFNIGVWQIFKGYKSNGEREWVHYSDATRKVFNFRLYRYSNDDWDIKINDVIVSGKHTIGLERYEMEERAKWKKK